MPTYKIESSNLVNCGEFILLEMDTPIQKLERLVSIKVLGSFASNLDIQYRYSLDGNSYSEWIKWNNWNNINSELTWLSFRVKSDTKWDFKGIEIDWIGLDLLDNCNCNIVKYNEDSFLIDGDSAQYEYNSALSAVSIWENMSRSVFDRFGWGVIYFKCDPVKQSKDVVFKEYSLLQVRGCKKIKVVVPDNDFGSGEFQFSEFDIDFSDDLQIEISKEMFWSAFGMYEQPAEKDFLYFPLEGRMYRVNSIQEKKDFMRKSIWWQGTLIKWNESDSILKNDDMQFMINDLTLDFENVGFNQEFKEEAIDITKDQQYVSRTVSISDNCRESVHVDWEINGIKEENLDNYFTVFSKYHYDLKYADTKYVIPGETAPNGGVAYGLMGTPLITYQHDIDMSKSVGIMFWYNAQNRTVKDNNTYRKLFSGEQDIEVLVNGNFLQKIKIFNKEYLVNIPVNDWYAYYIGINRIDNTITLRIWERADISKKTTKMSIKFEDVCKLKTEIVGNWKPILYNSNDKITSIRFLNSPVTLENQTVLFNKLVFPDDSLAYIVDDCWHMLRLERMSNQ